jgi:hypothetical protein
MNVLISAIHSFLRNRVGSGEWPPNKSNTIFTLCRIFCFKTACSYPALCGEHAIALRALWQSSKDCALEAFPSNSAAARATFARTASAGTISNIFAAIDHAVELIGMAYVRCISANLDEKRELLSDAWSVRFISYFDFV